MSEDCHDSEFQKIVRCSCCFKIKEDCRCHRFKCFNCSACYDCCRCPSRYGRPKPLNRVTDDVVHPTSITMQEIRWLKEQKIGW